MDENTRGDEIRENKEEKKTHNAPRLAAGFASETGRLRLSTPGDIKPRGKRKKKRKIGQMQIQQRGLFFSINNSFWRTGEGVKLDILGERGLQQRMTRNNEEILPQTLSPAEWRHESTKKN